LTNNSNGTDAKLFDSYIDAGNIYFRFVNDAYSAASTWLQATRSGYAISYVYITAPTVQVNGNLNAVNSVSGGAAQISQQNANTAANTQSRMEISTGTANSYAIWAVTENGSGASQALLTCGAGVTQGLQIQSATTAAPITFYQGSSLRLQIDSSGNVDVANALNVTGTTTLGGALTTTNPVVDANAAVAAPTTGTTVTIAATTAHQIINPSGTLAALTVVSPAAPSLGSTSVQSLDILFTQAITALTWTAGSGTTFGGAAMPSSAAAGACVRLLWVQSIAKWLHTIEV
jgi:hypothetical protein